MEQEKYGIGVSSFEQIRNSECIYVDKTKYIFDLLESGSHAYFLSRPRCFGRTLFLSTLKAFFMGKKELFEGLAIYDLEKNWEEYPVLHFDFTSIEPDSAVKFENYLRSCLDRIALKYDLTLKSTTGIGRTFATLIKGIAEKTGKKVVILIDEYDKAILEVLDNRAKLEMNLRVLMPFLSATKSQFGNIHFTFITGVSSFQHYSIFSGANHLYDISMHPEYVSVCGITLAELTHYFPQGIQKLQHNLNLPYEEVIEKLASMYGGNRFSYKDILVFNPFDLLSSFGTGSIRNYWLKSGTSGIFVKYLSKLKDFDFASLTKQWVSMDLMKGTFEEDGPIPLLFQYGYLTIKDFDSCKYKLGIPNDEVRDSLNALSMHYLGKSII